MTVSSMIRLGTPEVLDAHGNTVPDADVLFDNLLTVVHQVTQDLLTTHYNTTSLTQLSSGVDGEGKTLPSTAAAAADRLGWRPSTKVSNSRVLKMGQSNAVSILKGQAWRLELFIALLPILPPRDQLVYSQRALQKTTTRLAVKLGRYCDEVTIRSMVRSTMRYYDTHGTYPQTYCDLFPTPPQAPKLANLGAVDKQYATRKVETTEDGYVYVLSCILPSGEGDFWSYTPYTVRFTVPHCYHERVGAALADPDGGVTLPMLRLDKHGKLHISTTLEETPPAPPAQMHTVIGVDLNRDRMLTATVIHYNPETDTYTHSSHVYTFDGLGLFAKSLRLGQEQDELGAKIRRLSSLAKNNPDLYQCEQLEAKIAVLKLERERLNDKRGRIGVELSHDAASWIQTIVDVHSATGVFFENLASLPISFDTHTNTVLSQLPRGKILAYIEHRMTRLGVGVKTVRPSGTSSSCPYCLTKLTHPHGYTSAVCDTCGTSTHRDDLSPVRIAQKGHATHVRKKKQEEKRKLLNHKVVRLAKTGPTPKQVKDKYRKRRTRVKSSAYKKPVPFRKSRVVADMCVPSPEHMAYQVSMLAHTALVPPF